MTRFRGLLEQSGQTTVTAALGLVVVISFVALAVEVGHLYQVRRTLQMGADAAATAAALEIQTCAGKANCPAMQTAVQSALTENGISVASVGTNCGPPGGGALTVSINDPPCALGSQDANFGKTGFVEVTLNDAEPTFLARVLGITSMPVAVRSEAARIANRNCVYALDPTASNSISVDVAAVVKSSCGWVDESNSSSAFGCNLLAAVNVNRVNVVGGAENLLCNVSPTPLTGASIPKPTDPLAYLPKPAVPQCGTSTASPYNGSSAPLLLSGTVVLNPTFAYCGGITILPGANVTFQPGTYVIKSTQGLLGINPGGLTISLLANVTGNGVTFYNYGPSGGVTFLLSSVSLGGVTLTAPTSGTYSGVLFMQDPGDTAPATILGNSSLNTKLEGAFYFPSARVSYAVTGPEKYNILVANQIDFVVLTFAGSQYGTTFANDYSGLAMGSPVAGNSVALVQ